MPRHGLVVGKFYPPHAGHHLLIRAAAAACDRVSVVAMAASHESIPLARRVAWLRDEHASEPHVTITGVIDDVPIDYASDAIWHAHVELMRAALAAIDAPPVTHVFTSEPYGDELARRFAARAVLVDAARTLAPVSGAAVRADPAAHWSWLAPATRAGLALRIVVLGAESTGTTTLARALAAHWSAQPKFAPSLWVPEYGRTYTAQKWADAIARAQAGGNPPPALESLVWPTPEFEHIARIQERDTDAAARAGGPIVIGDTDALATAVWHERYLGRPAPTVLAIARRSPRPALYLVTDDAGVPYEQDGLRDPEGAGKRAAMNARCLALAAGEHIPAVLMRGPPAARLDAANDAIQQAMQRAWSFTAPFG